MQPKGFQSSKGRTDHLTVLSVKEQRKKVGGGPAAKKICARSERGSASHKATAAAAPAPTPVGIVAVAVSTDAGTTSSAVTEAIPLPDFNPNEISKQTMYSPTEDEDLSLDGKLPAPQTSTSVPPNQKKRD
jgi:hypothetical protein